jgi:phosphoribosylglycinamide formyltransferase 1
LHVPQAHATLVSLLIEKCMASLRLGVLVSGSGTTLQNLIDLGKDVRVVIGSRDGLGAEPRAARATIPYHVIARKSFDGVEAFSRSIFDVMEQAGVQLVVCAGWLQLLKIPPAWQGKVINVHPALLPAFGGKGMYGHHVHEAVLAHGCKVAGCTVHFVDDEYDHGPIISQRTCEVRDDDTPETLGARVMEQERIALPQAIAAIEAGQLQISGRSVRWRTSGS